MCVFDQSCVSYIQHPRDQGRHPVSRWEVQPSGTVPPQLEWAQATPRLDLSRRHRHVPSGPGDLTKCGVHCWWGRSALWVKV